ncbi:hypothetical protein WJX74_009599 [Apatococcus lobatus]|uniref:Uncharacterized protein n=1 Tax=Apatococcus lobatus TaxID=904363 RepID=A0AAW1R1Y9_9CHLO
MLQCSAALQDGQLRGLDCPLARGSSAQPRNSPEHYLTVLRSPSADDQDPDPAAKSNLEQFLWNFLALRSTLGPGSRESSADKAEEDLSCDPYKRPCAAGSACLGWKFDEGAGASGKCVQASVRYVPSYSLQFVCQDCDGTATFYNPDWQMTHAADSWHAAHGWPPNPQWTESSFVFASTSSNGQASKLPTTPAGLAHGYCLGAAHQQDPVTLGVRKHGRNWGHLGRGAAEGTDREAGRQPGVKWATIARHAHPKGSQSLDPFFWSTSHQLLSRWASACIAFCRWKYVEMQPQAP